MKLKPIGLIVAQDIYGIIGHGPKMPPWHLTDDYKLNFVPKTKGCPVIMGRITAESFEFGPLKNRTNIVLSRQEMLNLQEGFIPVKGLTEALSVAQKTPGEMIWIIGGAKVYQFALRGLVIDELHITKVSGSFKPEKLDDAILFPSVNFDLYKLHDSKKFEKREPSKQDGKIDNGNSHDFVVEVYKRVA